MLGPKIGELEVKVEVYDSCACVLNVVKNGVCWILRHIVEKKESRLKIERKGAKNPR